jgi:hypothetical protein
MKHSPIRTTKMIRLDDSKYQTHPANSNEGDVGAITLSLDRLGLYRAIVISEETGNICAGNHTYLAAKSLGWTEILAHLIPNLSYEEEIAILLADNQIASLATHDQYQLLDNMKFLAGTPQGLHGTGFDLDDLQTKMDELDTSGFGPDDEQPRLDSTAQVVCPSCGHRFSPVTHADNR